MPGAPHLLLRDPAEDELADDQPPPAVPVEEPQISIFVAPSVTVPIPVSCPDSNPTRMVDPNRVRGARLYTGTLIDLFFMRAELVPVGIITSLYICISYIYTYSYNFYYLSSLHSYCMSILSVTCSMSLAYLLSILLLYSCFYTLHIPYSFYNLLFYVFGISYLYFYCIPVSILCIFYIHSITYCSSYHIITF